MSFSLDKETREGLAELQEQGLNKSKIVEQSLQNIISGVSPGVMGTIDITKHEVSLPVTAGIQLTIQIDEIINNGTITTIIPAIVGVIQASIPGLEEVVRGGVGSILSATMYLTVSFTGSVVGILAGRVG